MHIHSRGFWKASKPKPRSRQSASSIRELFVHWPGDSPRSWRNVNTEAEEAAVMRQEQAFHMGPQRGWSDFAYSFAIFPSGRVYRGRGIDYVPASQLSHNTGTLSVCIFVGPDDTIPDHVIESLKLLRKYLENKCGHKLALRPHKSVTSTACPGPKLSALVGKLA